MGRGRERYAGREKNGMGDDRDLKTQRAEKGSRSTTVHAVGGHVFSFLASSIVWYDRLTFPM